MIIYIDQVIMKRYEIRYDKLIKNQHKAKYFLGGLVIINILPGLCNIPLQSPGQLGQLKVWSRGTDLQSLTVVWDCHLDCDNPIQPVRLCKPVPLDRTGP